MISNYCNDIFIAIKYHFEIFIVIDCKNNRYQVIAMIYLNKNYKFYIKEHIIILFYINGKYVIKIIKEEREFEFFN